MVSQNAGIHGVSSCVSSTRAIGENLDRLGTFVFSQLLPFDSVLSCRVVAIDMPGYGGSDKPKDKEFYTQESLADCIAGVIRALG